MLRPARWLAALLLLCGPAAAADLTLRIGGQTRVLTQAELLASPDAIETVSYTHLTLPTICSV